MRKPGVAAVAAGKWWPRDRDHAPAVVCLALMLAVVALGLRIATIW
jgi:hypothetical protein